MKEITKKELENLAATLKHRFRHDPEFDKQDAVEILEKFLKEKGVEIK